MEFLEKLNEGHGWTQYLNSLQGRKARLEEELRALTRQTNDVEMMDRSAGETGDKKESHSLLDILETYRLLGVSVMTAEPSLTLRFDTLYGNQHPATECHCVQLVKKGENYALGKHNLPPFVPIQQLEDKHLASSVVPFVSEIRNYLYAYVQRREGLKKVQENFQDNLVGKVDVNLPVTFVNMKLKVDESLPLLDIKLHYDLLRCLPGNVEVNFVIEESVIEAPAKQRRKMDRIVSQWISTLGKQDIQSAVTQLLE